MYYQVNVIVVILCFLNFRPGS